MTKVPDPKNITNAPSVNLRNPIAKGTNALRAYNNRAITPFEGDGLHPFFFPKHNPPVTIRAKSREEAEEKLAELDNQTDHE